MFTIAACSLIEVAVHLLICVAITVLSIQVPIIHKVEHHMILVSLREMQQSPHATLPTSLMRHLNCLTSLTILLNNLKTNEPIRPENDYNAVQHNNTHLQDSVVVGDNKDLEAARGFQFEFFLFKFLLQRLILLYVNLCRYI